MATSQYRRPFGNDFIVSTPHLDKFGQQVFLEEKMREAQRQKENAMLDDQYAKNVANIRDVDIPEYNQKYQEWRTARQGLLKMRNANSQDYIDRQMDANRKLADVYKLGNKSKQIKDEEEMLAKDAMQHPNNYAEDVSARLLARRNTPVSSLAGHPIYGDLSNPETFKYQLGTTDFSKDIKNAKGEQKPRGVPVTIQSPDGLTSQTKTYKGYNSPVEYFSNLMSSVVGSQKTKNLPLEHPYSPDDMQRIATQYEALKQSNSFKNAYGNVPDFPNWAYMTDAGRTAITMAMEHAINNPPVETISKPTQNLGNVMNRRLHDQMVMEGIKQGNRKELLALKPQIDWANKQERETWIDSYLDKIKSEATSPRPYKTAKGDVTTEYDIPLDATLAKALAKDGVQPDAAHVTSDGNIRGIWYKRNPKTNQIIVTKETGEALVDPIRSVPITTDAVKLSLGKTAAGTTQTNVEMSKGKHKETKKIKLSW